MSRIGKRAVAIPSGAKVSFANGVFVAEGPKGKQEVTVPSVMIVDIQEKNIHFDRTEDTKYGRAQHGLIRNLVNNALIGVTQGYVKKLDIHGVGFKGQMKGKIANFALGYSHEINYQIPDGVTVTMPQQTHVIVEGPDKVLVGQVAAKIRSFFKPEPYKGKGVRYSNEQILRKQGKVVG